jgi:plasmid stability protein
MAALLLKNMPAEMHAGLKRRAERNRRSLTQEAFAILEAALQADASRPTLEEIRRWQVRGARPLTDAFLRRAIRRGRS